YEGSQRRAAELEVVADMARAISSQTRPDAVLDEVHDQIRRIMPVDASTVCLSATVVAAAWPSGEAAPAGAPDPLGLAGEGAAARLVVVRAYRGDGRMRDDEGTV